MREAIESLPASVQQNIAACVAECHQTHAGALKRDLVKAAATRGRLPECKLRKLARYTLALPVASSDDVQTLVRYYESLQEVHHEIRAVLKRARSEDNASVHAISLWSTPPRKVISGVTWLELVVDADCGITKEILLDHLLRIKKIIGIVDGQPIVAAATSANQPPSDELDDFEGDRHCSRAPSAATSAATDPSLLDKAGKPTVSRTDRRREFSEAGVAKTAKCSDARCKGTSKRGCSNSMCGAHCTGCRVHKHTSQSANGPPHRTGIGKSGEEPESAAKVVNGQLHRPVIVESEDGLTRAQRLELRKKRIAMLATDLPPTPEPTARRTGPDAVKTVRNGRGTVQSSGLAQSGSTMGSVVRRKVVMEGEDDDGEQDRKPKRVKLERDANV